MPQELMPVTSTLPTLPERRSNAYKQWLAIELGRLAVALGQQQQLDSNGWRQAAFAEDLADTQPRIMEAAFARWRREQKFLPTVSEIRDYYRAELVRLEDRNALAQIQHEESKRMANPDAFISTAEAFRELPALTEKLSIDRKAESRARQHSTPEPQTSECPHCGGKLAHSIGDLRALSSSDLRAMADRRDQAATQRAAAAQAISGQSAATKPATAAKRAKKRGTK